MSETFTRTAPPVPEPAEPEAYRLLAAWWRANARDLPWRFGRTTPWGILVSEVMSQQTQMSRVVPYWTEWMAVWPDAAALARASSAEVITAWGRLGYPRRALRLQECARRVTQEYDDRLPDDYQSLVDLPGVGDYTASAVLSFAFGRRVAVIDTNIRRVLSRVFLGVESHGGTATPAERKMAQEVLPVGEEESVIWNQAVMEVGALVCLPKAPRCEQCPLRGSCLFLKDGLPGLGQGRTRPRQGFKGTDRQVRGLILAALRGHPAGWVLDRGKVEGLWADQARLGACLASLDDDGLIEILPGGSIRLPI
ncbi:A/G-specific adenine glycosylase [Bifidobacterium favimelis]|uniref:Adenine DNA glycosylase n=1 Tax=Bifidobacterium favimelis TaxID=3122979 RepID=A0ABU8ZPT4_9BIFI